MELELGKVTLSTLLATIPSKSPYPYEKITLPRINKSSQPQSEASRDGGELKSSSRINFPAESFRALFSGVYRTFYNFFDSPIFFRMRSDAAERTVFEFPAESNAARSLEHF